MEPSEVCRIALSHTAFGPDENPVTGNGDGVAELLAENGILVTKQVGLLEETGFRVFLKNIGRTLKVGEFSGEATPVWRPDNGQVTVQVDRSAESRLCGKPYSAGAPSPRRRT